ncbi:glycosyltransferase family 39 protein [Thiobacillus sp.]
MPTLLHGPDLQLNQEGLGSIKPITFVSGILLLSLFGLFIAIASKLTGPMAPQDEGILLVYPDLILKGFMPGKDFSALYPPGNFYIIAGAFHLFGTNIIVERLIGFLYMYLIVVAAFFLGLQLGRVTGILSATTSLILLSFFPSAGAYSIHAAIALAIFSLLSSHLCVISDNTYISARWGLIAGIFVGLALLFRQDIAIIAGVACTLMIAVSHIRYLKQFLFGALVAALPFIVFSFNVGWLTVWDNLFLDIQRVGPGRHLPLHLSFALLALLLSIFTSFIAASVFVIRWKRSPYFPLILGSGIFSLGILPSALQRADIWHIVYVFSATGTLAVISVSALILQFSKELHSPTLFNKSSLLISATFGKPFNLTSNRLSVLLILIVLCATPIFLLDARETYWNIQKSKNRQVMANDRWVLIDQSRVRYLQGLTNTLLSIVKPGDRLFVGPNDLRRTNYNDTFIYYLFPNLRPASYYLEMNPGSANRAGSRLSQDVASADIVVLTTKYDTWNEPNESVKFGDITPNRIIANKYCLHSNHGEYSIYLRCNHRKQDI